MLDTGNERKPKVQDSPPLCPRVKHSTMVLVDMNRGTEVCAA